MKMLSDDDLDLAGLTDEELAQAWDLWFDLAQATNDSDPAWTHGVFVGILEAERSGESEIVNRRLGGGTGPATLDSRGAPSRGTRAPSRGSKAPSG